VDHRQLLIDHVDDVAQMEGHGGCATPHIAPIAGEVGLVDLLNPSLSEDRLKLLLD
jgi:hypothetical protein